MGNNKNDLKIPKIFTGGETTSSTEKKVPTIKSHCGIGHTRWATHGVVNEENAHPHISNNGKITIRYSTYKIKI